MAQRLPIPFPTFFDSTGAPYAGGTLTFYAGTTNRVAPRARLSLDEAGEQSMFAERRSDRLCNACIRMRMLTVICYVRGYRLVAL